MSREPNTLVARRRRLGESLATFRQAAGITQAQLGARTCYDRTSINKIEHGAQLPDRHFWVAVDQLLRADAALLAEYDELIAATRAHLAQQRRATPAQHQAEAARLRTRTTPRTSPVRRQCA